MLRWMRSRRRGAAMVEYSLLLVAVGIPAIAGITAGGIALYNGYLTARDSLLHSTP